MNILNCDVINCANNKNKMCKLQKIQVEGPAACVKDQTCCFSFVERKGIENSVLAYVSKGTKVKCKAENCKFNKGGKCSAEELIITNMTNCPKVMGETECATFTTR